MLGIFRFGSTVVDEEEVDHWRMEGERKGQLRKVSSSSIDGGREAGLLRP